MSSIKGIGLIICVLMVLMAYLKQAIPRGKMTQLMKAMISIFILVSLINGIRSFDLRSLKNLIEKPYARNDEVWSKAAELVGDGLKSEFENFLKSENVEAEVIHVLVENDRESFKIVKVSVCGADAEAAKNLLAGRYQIGIANIEVKNE